MSYSENSARFIEVTPYTEERLEYYRIVGVRIVEIVQNKQYC